MEHWVNLSRRQRAKNLQMVVDGDSLHLMEAGEVICPTLFVRITIPRKFKFGNGISWSKWVLEGSLFSTQLPQPQDTTNKLSEHFWFFATMVVITSAATHTCARSLESKFSLSTTENMNLVWVQIFLSNYSDADSWRFSCAPSTISPTMESSNDIVKHPSTTNPKLCPSR